MPRKIAAKAGNIETKTDTDAESLAAETVPRRRPPARAAGAAAVNPKKPSRPRTKATPSQPGRADVRKEEKQEEPPAVPTTSLHEQIAQLAYSYWEARGYQQGDPQEDWYRAEREVLGRLHVPKDKTRK